MDKHELNIFPEMLPEDYARLKSDIENNGYDVKYPIWFYEGKILDGWNREKICNELRPYFSTDYDETQSIGRRYRRQDEIGTPYAVTVDFDTLQDKAVTVRDRDTMKQDRIKIKELVNYLKDVL